MYLVRYLATKAPRRQDYRVIFYYSLFNAWNIEINEKTTLFNNIYLFFGSLCLGG